MNGSTRSASRTRFLRIRALLVGGLVLGVGAAVTMASWVDNEVATGAFGASIFNTVSSSQGSASDHHTTAPGAALTFNAAAMSPGTSGYAWLNVQTTPQTNVTGSLNLSGQTFSNTSAVALSPYLQYRIVLLPNATATCAAASFAGTPSWVTPATGAYTVATAALPASVSVPLSTAGTTVQRLCVEVQLQPLTPNDRQGQTATLQWTFTATSSS
ncbi:SipW-dependent-type signal peptide-containing protein [Lysinibacter cavernae]|uniref:Putative ribosomally synthesized peptide with SipW-like signal peptide n=1 Tax=Lysinibacter cavernae TaxID=1640652 RepID=A0A7X5R0L7_9MICO|nr:SipW-dependent-type signal peptide-containing protein [Lysinibacter cavernae]NIH53448.1 putative ribosomally synthesized peptide with SipW-like signal peptide [Lysinibacter cavernae]